MGMTVTGQSAGICAAAIRNRRAAVRCDYVDIEVDQPLTRDVGIGGAHSVPGVTGRTSEPVVDVPAVLAETRVRHDETQIVTLATHPVGAIHREIRVGKEIGYELARRGRLRELVATFQDVHELRAVRSVRSGAAEFAVVVTVMTIAAKDLCPHRAPLADAVNIGHVLTQAGLRKRAVARMGYGMARGRRHSELRNDVQGIGR